MDIIFVCGGNPKIVIDLKGVTYLRLDEERHTLTNKIRVWLDRIK